MFDNLSKSASRLILLVIGGLELLVTEVMFWSISPQLIERVGLLAIGVIIVVFKIAARIKRRYITWAIGALMCFIATFSFFLTIVSSGYDSKQASTAATVAVQVSENTKRLQKQYDMDSEAFRTLLRKQSETSAENRTYASTNLPIQIDAQKRLLEADAKNLADAEVSDKSVAAFAATERVEKFDGLAVFGRIPNLLLRLGRDFYETCAIVIAMIFGVALGLFIELTMIASAADSIAEKEKRYGARSHVYGMDCNDNSGTDNVQALADKQAVTVRQYLLACWPQHEVLIKAAAQVSATTNWPVSVCEKLEDELFNGFVLEPVGSMQRLACGTSREKFLRDRRRKNERHQGNNLRRSSA